MKTSAMATIKAYGQELKICLRATKQPAPLIITV